MTMKAIKRRVPNETDEISSVTVRRAGGPRRRARPRVGVYAGLFETDEESAIDTASEQECE